jgi:hypothetical protein
MISIKSRIDGLEKMIKTQFKLWRVMKVIKNNIPNQKTGMDFKEQHLNHRE